MSRKRRALRAADRPSLAAEVAARLRAGELCVLPTETVYGLAVLPSHAAAVAKARQLKGRSDQQAFTLHLARREDLGEHACPPPARVQRLLDRYWPGPLTLVLPAAAGGTVGLRLPAHEFTRAVIEACGEPLWMTSVNRTAEPPLLDAAAIEAAFGDQLAIVVDDGPSPLGMASTIVRATGQRLEVLREGILSADEVLRTAADLVLFVCTGNTCRSPLAEALARDLTARHLGVPAADLPAIGVDFASAGIATLPGMPASEYSVAAGAEVHLDLSGHESRQIEPDQVRRANHIYCLGQSHRRAILAEVPEAADKVKLLRPDGLDVADPYGGELSHYRKARDEIRAAVAARLAEWLPQHPVR